MLRVSAWEVVGAAIVMVPATLVILLGQTLQTLVSPWKQHTFDPTWTLEIWTKRIERMRAHGTIGVLRQSRKLKNSLQPITEQSDHLELELNELARERCKIVFDEYKRRLSELDNHPVRLADFAEFVATTQRISGAQTRFPRDRVSESVGL